MTEPWPFNQFVLDFPFEPVSTFENYAVGDGNLAAYEAVKSLDSTKTTALTLTGEEGTGKSHLLQAAVHAARSKLSEKAVVYLDLATLSATLQKEEEGEITHFLSEFEQCRFMAVDNLDELRDHDTLQKIILFLFNRFHEDGGQMVFASRLSPQKMDWLRSDLSSRLLWGPVVDIAPPGDHELGAILTKMALDRQVHLSSDLKKFLQLRLPRCVPDYARAINLLDRASQGLQRSLTVPLAKEVLGL